MAIKNLKKYKIRNGIILLGLVLSIGMNFECSAGEESAIDGVLSSTVNLMNVPVGSFGLDAVEVYNFSSYTVSNIKISFPNSLPTDITFNSRTTCKLDGTQQLAPNQSCVIVFEYSPRIEGVNSLLPLAVAGLNGTETISLLATIVPYYSRITSGPHPATVLGLHPKLGNLTLTSPATVSYGTDSIQNIPVGSFGLKTYIVTNVTENNLYNISFPVLSGTLSYNSRSTCKFNNLLELAPNQSCTIVIQYTPLTKGFHSVLPVQVAGVDDSYDVIANNMLDVTYSSRN